jgi:hypothetical protein
MNRTITLHIGTEKTGTTSIQKTLSQNLHLLRQRGINYFGPVFSGEILRCSTKLEPKQPRRLGRLQQSLNLYPNTIVSNELFHSRLRSVRQVEYLKNACMSLNPDRIQVIVYLRRQAETANSMIATAARVNRNLEQSPLSEYVRILSNHRETLMLWSSVFGRENLIPRLFSKSRLVNSNLLHDFFAAIDADYDGLQPAEPQNEALSWDGVLIARSVHRQLQIELPHLDLKSRHRFGATICHKSISPVYKSPKLHLHPSIWSLFDDEYRGVNDWLRREWFINLSHEHSQLFSSWLPADETRPSLAPSEIDEIAARMIESHIKELSQLP